MEASTERRSRLYVFGDDYFAIAASENEAREAILAGVDHHIGITQDLGTISPKVYESPHGQVIWKDNRPS